MEEVHLSPVSSMESLDLEHVAMEVYATNGKNESIDEVEANYLDVAATDVWSCVTYSDDDYDLVTASDLESRASSPCWELLSSSKSCTVTVNDARASYSEVVKKGGARKTRHTDMTLTSKKHVKTATKTKPIPQKDASHNEVFDADFVMDGVKSARGGRGTLMFRGNQKTPRPIPAVYRQRQSRKTSATKQAFRSKKFNYS